MLVITPEAFATLNPNPRRHRTSPLKARFQFVYSTIIKTKHLQFTNVSAWVSDVVTQAMRKNGY